MRIKRQVLKAGFQFISSWKGKEHEAAEFEEHLWQNASQGDTGPLRKAITKLPCNANVPVNNWRETADRNQFLKRFRGLSQSSMANDSHSLTTAMTVTANRRVA